MPKTCDTKAATTQIQDMIIRGALEKIKNKFIVMSGKGGVGKSSVAANLAIALATCGYTVGLLDIDLHGPSIPKILGLKGELSLPLIYANSLKVVSIESLLQDKDSAVIWRGPIKLQAIRSFLADIEWGELDYLIADSPPGTGDEPLTIAQTISDAKAIIVTTPQEISLQDIRKSINFCRQVKMEVFGIIENMSGFICPHCRAKIDLFKTGGGERTAIQMKVPFLGRIPFDIRVVEATDKGLPYLANDKNSEAGKAFDEMVKKVIERTLPRESQHPVQSMEKVLNTSKEVISMKIAIPVEGGRLASHFGHCREFAFFDVENSTVKNRTIVAAPPHQPGLLPNWMHEHGVNVVIAGGMGQRAQGLFAQYNIMVITGAPNLPPEEIVNQYLNGTLITGPNVCDH
ncbi:MAG TPA: chromosome partitioning protein ParA [Syntrophaceae bacterium]|nr:chromosome partitioning protein ParA [Syntrophaceae bacterium]